MKTQVSDPKFAGYDEAQPRIQADELEYWPVPGTGRIAGMRGHQNLSKELADERSDLMRELHAKGAMKRGEVLKTMSAQSKNSFSDYVLSHLSAFQLKKTRTRRSYLVVLTYGDHYPNPKESKVDLDNLAKAFTRRFPYSSFVWGLEAQERQAPHYNLLVTINDPDCDIHEWFTSTWIRLTGTGGSPAHSRYEHAVICEPIYNAEGAAIYVAQELGKVEQKTFQKGHPGRWWGVVQRKHLRMFYREPLRTSVADCWTRMIQVALKYRLNKPVRITLRSGEKKWCWFVRSRWFGWAAQYIITGCQKSFGKVIDKVKKIFSNAGLSILDEPAILGIRG